MKWIAVVVLFGCSSNKVDKVTPDSANVPIDAPKPLDAMPDAFMQDPNCKARGWITQASGVEEIAADFPPGDATIIEAQLASSNPLKEVIAAEFSWQGRFPNGGIPAGVYPPADDVQGFIFYQDFSTEYYLMTDGEIVVNSPSPNLSVTFHNALFEQADPSSNTLSGSCRVRVENFTITAVVR